MFQIIKKIVKVLNVSWMVSEVDEDGAKVEVEKKSAFKDVEVRFANGLTMETLSEWGADFHGLDLENEDDQKKAAELKKKLENVVRHFNEKILQHEASTAYRALGVKVAKGEAASDALSKFVYKHDYTAEKKVAQTEAEKAAKLLAGLSDADRAKLLAMFPQKKD
jgi:hypothetical protein